jgi:hypothetical protein
MHAGELPYPLIDQYVAEQADLLRVVCASKQAPQFQEQLVSTSAVLGSIG